MFMEEAKPIRNVLLIFMLVGFIFLIAGSAICFKILVIDRRSSVPVTGYITDVRNNSTSVEYTVNGRKYNKTYSVYNSTYYVGKKIKVRYNKNNPNKSYLPSIGYILLIIPGLGILFLGISGIGFMYIYTKYIQPLK